MNSDKLAGRLGLVSPTLALRYEDRPEAFEGLLAVEAGAAFLPDGSPNPDYQRKLNALLGHTSAAGAPPWVTSNITASTTGREYNEAIAPRGRHPDTEEAEAMSFQGWYANEGREPAMPQIAITTEPREPEPSPPFGVPLLVIEVLDRWDMGPTQRRCRVRCRAEDGFDGIVTVMDDLDVGQFFRLADPMAPRELAVEDEDDSEDDGEP